MAYRDLRRLLRHKPPSANNRFKLPHRRCRRPLSALRGIVAEGISIG
jgi:hypothetical protein